MKMLLAHGNDKDNGKRVVDVLLEDSGVAAYLAIGFVSLPVCLSVRLSVCHYTYSNHSTSHTQDVSPAGFDFLSFRARLHLRYCLCVQHATAQLGHINTRHAPLMSTLRRRRSRSRSRTRACIRRLLGCSVDGGGNRRTVHVDSVVLHSQLGAGIFELRVGGPVDGDGLAIFEAVVDRAVEHEVERFRAVGVDAVQVVESVVRVLADSPSYTFVPLLCELD